MPVSLDIYLAFVAASLVVLLVPGPTVLLVIAHSLREGRRATVPTIAGVVVGDALAVTVSLAGLGAVLAASAALFTALKWVGAAYLVWLGLRSLIEKPCGGWAAADSVESTRRLAGRAFIVTALNPKGIAFFVAFVPQFFNPGAPLLPQMVLMGVTFVALAGVTNSGYSLAAARIARHLTRPLWRNAMRWSSGLVLIGAGLMTATLRRA